MRNNIKIQYLILTSCKAGWATGSDVSNESSIGLTTAGRNKPEIIKHKNLVRKCHILQGTKRKITLVVKLATFYSKRKSSATNIRLASELQTF